MDTVIFTDRAIAEIATHVGTCPPEAGGALLGILNTNVITEYIADTDAITYFIDELKDIEAYRGCLLVK